MEHRRKLIKSWMRCSFFVLAAGYSHGGPAFSAIAGGTLWVSAAASPSHPPAFLTLPGETRRKRELLLKKPPKQQPHFLTSYSSIIEA